MERATEVVLGYTCANDVTARDLQRSDGQWARAKGFDTFCPLGPWIETELDSGDLADRSAGGRRAAFRRVGPARWCTRSPSSSRSSPRP